MTPGRQKLCFHARPRFGPPVRRLQLPGPVRHASFEFRRPFGLGTRFAADPQPTQQQLAGDRHEAEPERLGVKRQNLPRQRRLPYH